MSLEFLLVYSITVFVASIIPGPSMLLALTHGMKYGARRTVSSALGNASVTLLQAIISGAGLGAVLLASESLFNFIKWIGAAYLIYMGICLWLSPHMAVSEDINGHHSDRISLRKMYGQAALVTAGNPKAIVFFTAVFPQFIKPGSSYLPQFSILMATGLVIAFSCFMTYAICGQKIVALFTRASLGGYINKIIGSTFIGAGIGLAVSRK